MKIQIEIIKGSSMKEVLNCALMKKGFESYVELAKLVAAKTGSSEHSELNSISRIMNGGSDRVSADRAKVYAGILGIPEKDLLVFCKAGNYYKKAKPIMIEDDVDITSAIKKLASREKVGLDDLVKELLYLSHQV